jgi:N-acyl-D-amino-acid deacylase
MRLLVKGARVVDGSGAAPFEADVLVEGDRIAAVGPGLEASSGARVVEASGLVVCPGFIDMHGHNDLRVLDDPAVAPKLMQGITTEVLGQDGISMAPLPPERAPEWRQYLAEFDGTSESVDWSYGDTAGYLAMLERAGPAANCCYVVPNGNLRLAAAGLEGRPLSAAESERMTAILRRELEAGAFGLSAGLIYAPSSYASAEELAALCSAVREYDGVFMVHQRSEADAILESADEILEIGRRSGVHVHFSHLKVCGKKNAGKLGPLLAKFDEAEAAGLELSFDQYPYAFGSTSMGVLLPPWAHDGGIEALLARLARGEERRRMRADIEAGIPGWDNFVDFAGFDGIFLTSAPGGRNERFIGKSLVEMAAARGGDPFEALFDIVLEERNQAGIVDFYGAEDMVSRIMARPEMTACTDGILDERPHPRVYGAFPRILGKYVREEGLLSLEAAVHRMTGRSAAALRLADRGLVRPGRFADLVLLDPDRVRDRATFEEPTLPPEGIELVLVNGEIEVESGALTGRRAGRVLRRTGARRP